MLKFNLFFFISLFCFLQVQAVELDSLSVEKKEENKQPRKNIPHKAKHFDNKNITELGVYLQDSLLASPGRVEKIVLSRYPSDDYMKPEKVQKKDNSIFENVIVLRPAKPSWPAYVGVSLLLIFSVFRIRYSKNLDEIFKSYFNNRYLGFFIRDDSFFRLRSSFLMLLFFIIVASLFIYQIVNLYHWEIYNPKNGIFPILLVVFIFYIVKYQILRVISYVFSLEKIMLSYSTILSVSNIFFAMISFPFLIVVPYLQNDIAIMVMYFLITLWIANLGYKYIRTAMYLIFNFRFYIFYLFVYLCTLEIAPLLFILKLVSDHHD